MQRQRAAGRDIHTNQGTLHINKRAQTHKHLLSRFFSSSSSLLEPSAYYSSLFSSSACFGAPEGTRQRRPTRSVWRRAILVRITRQKTLSLSVSRAASLFLSFFFLGVALSFFFLSFCAPNLPLLGEVARRRALQCALE